MNRLQGVVRARAFSYLSTPLEWRPGGARVQGDPHAPLAVGDAVERLSAPLDWSVPHARSGYADAARAPLFLIVPALASSWFFRASLRNLVAMSFLTTESRAYVSVPTLETTRALSATRSSGGSSGGRSSSASSPRSHAAPRLSARYNLARASSRMKGMLLCSCSRRCSSRRHPEFRLDGSPGRQRLINSVVKHWGLAPRAQAHVQRVRRAGRHRALYLPFMVLSLSGALQNIPRDLELAPGAWAPRHHVFWRIVFPLLLPGSSPAACSSSCSPSART